MNGSTGVPVRLALAATTLGLVASLSTPAQAGSVTVATNKGGSCSAVSSTSSGTDDSTLPVRTRHLSFAASVSCALPVHGPALSIAIEQQAYLATPAGWVEIARTPRSTCSNCVNHAAGGSTPAPVAGMYRVDSTIDVQLYVTTGEWFAPPAPPGCVLPQFGPGHYHLTCTLVDFRTLA